MEHKNKRILTSGLLLSVALCVATIAVGSGALRKTEEKLEAARMGQASIKLNHIAVNEESTERNATDLGKYNIPLFGRMLSSTTIDKSTINEIYNKPIFAGTVGQNQYEVRKMEDDSLLFVIYSENCVKDIWRLNNLFNRDEFNEIVVGESCFEDIKKVDPYAELFVLRNGSVEAISEHRLMSGKSLIVSYKKENEQWIVDKTNEIEDFSRLSAAYNDYSYVNMASTSDRIESLNVSEKANVK